MQRTPFISAAAAAVLALVTLAPTHAAEQATVIIRSGPTLEYRNLPPPPPPRIAHRPNMRRGHVWVDGHWEWRGTRYRWVDGYWLQARRGYAYQQPQWVQRNGQWTYIRGDWRRGDAYRSGSPRDRDRDGIADRYDRHLGNDGLRNDRDGDGVPNRNDRYPNNPRRN